MRSKILANVLTLSGLIPFILCLVVYWISPSFSAYAILSHYVFIIYGSIILSFIGGIHWGLGLKEDNNVAFLLYLNSNVAALFAFAAAILANSELSLALLAIGFSGQWLIDFKYYPHERWFVSLRTSATIVVLLMIALLALT